MGVSGEFTYLGDLRSPHSGVCASLRAVKAQIRPILSLIGIINLPQKTPGPMPFPFPSRNNPDFSNVEVGKFLADKNLPRA